MKNKKILIILIVSVCLIGGFIIYNQNNKSTKDIKSENEVDNNKIHYTIIYNENSKSQQKINIYNGKVEVIKSKNCTTKDCAESNEELETFNYSKENMNKLKKFIEYNFSIDKDYNIELNSTELTERQKEVIQGLLLGENNLEIDIEEYKYKMEYSMNNSISYVVYFKNDNSILVKKLNIKDYDIEKIDTYSLNFSQESLNILNEYIEKEVKEQKRNIIYKYATLKKDEIKIMSSIVENQEAYLENIQSEPKLKYTITYHGLNCQTPILYLYNDNTYEYYYTFSTNNEKLNPKTGTYNYDITKIINNIDKYKEDPTGPYSIKENNGKSYSTYITNIELQEFLKSINVSLSKCLIQQ